MSSAPLPVTAGGEAPATPKDAVKAFFDAAQRGKCSETRSLFTDEALALLRQRLGSLDAYCQAQTRDRTVQGLEIVSEEVEGEAARVRYRLTFRKGVVIDYEELIRREGAWKLTVARSSQVGR
jgi:hypothetical protein